MRTPHPPGISNPFCGGSMDIFWNYAIHLECRPLPILDQSVLTIYDDDDDDVNVIFFGKQWLPKRLTPQTSDVEVGQKQIEGSPVL